VKILYVASDQSVPGHTGGSVHVQEVAQGLAARGHLTHAVVRHAGTAVATEQRDGVLWHRVAWWPPHRLFRFRARASVAKIAAEVAPDVVIERYYNFGGEGVLVARQRGIPALLEVNSPIVDHPGSVKGALDAALFGSMRRYREALCRHSAALVSPLLEIVPEFARGKTELVTWGANVDAFRPQRREPELLRRLGVPAGAVCVVFSGSFRPWHGVHVFEAAAERLVGRADIFFLLVGGPDAGEPRRFRGRRLGAVAYERMPELLASADIGVAPYDTSRLKQLRLGFYWSPLKVFEYMASGLPPITIARHPLTEIVRAGVDGLHFEEANAAALARAIEALADDPALRQRLGQSARERVVARYSWARHCEQLERVLLKVAA